MNSAQRLLRSAFRSLLGIYFRSIEVVGERPSADTRGRVFIANHSNALLDPILVMTNAPCDMSPLAKSTLWNIPGLPYLLDLADAVPVQRRSDDPSKPASANDEFFDKVARHLAAGGNVLVFPEGTSHNEPHMIRLKTGAARMLERARALGATELTFQAVGLEFDERHAFRSRAVVAHGPVRRLEDVRGDDPVENITRAMHDDLVELVIEGSSWDERRLVLKVAELVRNEQHGDLSFAEAVRIAQGVEHARDRLRRDDAPLAETTERALADYFDALERAGATDEQLMQRANAEPSTEEQGPVGKPVHPLSWLTLPLLPVGVALYWVPYQLPRIVARRTTEIDQHSTLKLATGIVAYPIWAALLAGGASVALRSKRARTLAFATILASPFAALYWLEHIEELRPAMRLKRRKQIVRELLEKRAGALEAIARARAAVGA